MVFRKGTLNALDVAEVVAVTFVAFVAVVAVVADVAVVAVVAEVALPDKAPENVVAARVPVDGLYVSLVLDTRTPLLPEAAVKNVG